MDTDLEKPLKRTQFRATLGTERLVICATTGAAAEDNMGSPNNGVCISLEASLITVYDQAYKAGRAYYPYRGYLTSKVSLRSSPLKYDSEGNANSIPLVKGT